MKKTLSLLVVLIILLTGCSKKPDDTEPVTPPQQEPNEEVESQLITTESKDGVNLTLTFEKSKNQSQIVGQVTNNSDKVLKTVKVNVKFKEQDVSRVMYLSQELQPNDVSNEFVIAGPTNNKIEDIEFEDMVLTFDEDDSSVVTPEPTDPQDDDEDDDQSSQQPDTPQPTQQSKTFELVRFTEEYILQMSDIPPTLSITTDGKLVATFKNGSDYPIVKYTLGFDFDGKSYTLNYEGKTAKGDTSAQFGLLDIPSLNLDSIKLKTLTVIAEYENNQKLNVKYTMDPVGSAYQITY